MIKEDCIRYDPIFLGKYEVPSCVVDGARITALNCEECPLYYSKDDIEHLRYTSFMRGAAPEIPKQEVEVFKCAACGRIFASDKTPKYCIHCGRKSYMIEW